MSLAVGVNLVLFGLTAPFAAAPVERFGVRAVVSAALLLIAAGSGLSVGVTSSWQLVLLWGVLIGLGTGSMALVFAATMANRWFVRRRGLVMGLLTAASATGQLVFLPVVAWMTERSGWRAASLVVSAAALAVIPLVQLRLRDSPAELGVAPYGAPSDPPSAARGPTHLRTAPWPIPRPAPWRSLGRPRGRSPGRPACGYPPAPLPPVGYPPGSGAHNRGGRGVRASAGSGGRQPGPTGGWNRRRRDPPGGR